MSDKSTMAQLQNCKDGLQLQTTKTHHDSMQDGHSAQMQVFGPGAMTSALRSVGPWALLHMRSVPGLDEGETEISSSTFNGKGTEEGAADPPDEEDQSEEDVPPVLFQSKYIDMFPLYQDYLPSLTAALQRASEGALNDLVTCHFLPGLQSPISSDRFTTEFSSPTTSCSPMVTQPTPSPQPVRVNPSCTLWQDLPEVKESGLLNTLTTRELQLQEARFELIGSEASYLRSLGIAVNHFFASKELRKSLSRREQHILFSNLRHVMEASESFLMELETLLGANVLISHVEDIVLNHCSTFQAHYVPYVTNMQYQEALVCTLLENNRHFLRAMKKLEGDPVCHRRGLKSFLILPFQRITRLKLIMQNILKLTKPDCGAISSLKQSIEDIHQIVDKCNKGVQRMQEIEQLVQLELRLDFGTVKKVPLIVSGRVLVHEGALRQLTLDERPSSQMSFTDVYLHLFNDLLVISLKKDQRFVVVDHAVFPTHVRVKLLKPNALGPLGLPSDSFLLHLSQNCTGQPAVMILATLTRSDKEVWMKVLM